jgi:Lamin Tail Domain
MLKAHAQCEQHFDQFPNTEQWIFHDSDFVINSNNQLQLQAIGSGFSSMSWDISNCAEINSEWDFYIKQSFAGSSNNFGKIYFNSEVISDSLGFDESAQSPGYVLRLGSTGSNDQIEWLKDNGSGNLLSLASGFNIANGINGWIKVKRANGYEVYFKDNDSTDFIFLFNCLDTTYSNFTFINFQFHYTSSNSDNFYLDDCYSGPFYEAPVVYAAEYRDIVINEIMSDPSPSRGQAEVEYIELYNNKPFPISLAQWEWVNSSTHKIINAGQIDSMGYLILCDANAVFNFNMPAIGIESFGLLTNGGDSLSLLSAQGQLIDFVVYNTQDFEESGIEGGYALEQIRPQLPCSDHFNWKQSCATSGGTPGSINCQFESDPNRPPLSIVDYGIDTLGHLFIWTAYPLEQDTVVLYDNEFSYSLPIHHLSDSAWISCDLLMGQNSNSVTISQLISCLDDTLQNAQLRIALPTSAQPHQLQISEILSHPDIHCPSFIEIYNITERFISVDGLRLESSSANAKEIQFHHHFLLPHQALCLSENPYAVQQQYPLLNPYHPQHHACNIPYLTQSEGFVSLRKNSTLIDTAHYNENWHHPLIQNPQGVSLEKIKIPCPSNGECWTSSPEHFGFATPGIYWQEEISFTEKLRKKWYVPADYFSPNMDDSNDQLYVHWEGDIEPHTITIDIHQLDGSWVRSLCQQEINLSPAIWQWEGLDHQGRLCADGIYFLVVQDQTDHSKKTEFVKSIVLSP